MLELIQLPARTRTICRVAMYGLRSRLAGVRRQLEQRWPRSRSVT
jgi:hypothetical protein